MLSVAAVATESWLSVHRRHPQVHDGPKHYLDSWPSRTYLNFLIPRSSLLTKQWQRHYIPEHVYSAVSSMNGPIIRALRPYGSTAGCTLIYPPGGLSTGELEQIILHMAGPFSWLPAMYRLMQYEFSVLAKKSDCAETGVIGQAVRACNLLVCYAR